VIIAGALLMTRLHSEDSCSSSVLSLSEHTEPRDTSVWWA